MSSIPIPPLGPVYGALFFATVISTAFCGMTWMQTYIYFLRYQDDRLRLKALVAILWALNSAHQALTISGTYKYFRMSIENLNAIAYAIPDLFLAVFLGILVALLAQGFFVGRIYIFSGKNIIVPLVWVIPAVYQLVAILLYVGKALFISNGGIQAVPLATLGDTFFMDISVSYLAVTAGVDVLIAMSMTLLLSRKRGLAHYKSTTKQLQRLVIFAIVSGTWTAVFALLAAILVRVESSNLIYSVFSTSICSLYCNTLLANLNARAYIRGESSPHADTDMMMSALSGVETNRTNGKPPSISPRNQGIWKMTEVVTYSDAESATRV